MIIGGGDDDDDDDDNDDNDDGCIYLQTTLSVHKTLKVLLDVSKCTTSPPHKKRKEIYNN